MDTAKIKIRYVIAEVTALIAVPVPYGTPDLDRAMTNEGMEHYANTDCDVVEELLPLIAEQDERDCASGITGHLKVKVLRDANEKDEIEFSIGEMREDYKAEEEISVTV